MLRRITATVGAAALVAASLTLTANAAPTTAEECVKEGNVWVHVQYDDVVSGACATEYATASQALLSTGLTEDTTAWLSTVNGRTADGVDGREFWAIWSQTPVDGAYTGTWDYAQVGITELELTSGMVLGVDLWNDWLIEAEAPTVDPVQGVVLGDDPVEPIDDGGLEPSLPPVSPTPSAPATTPGVPSSGV